MNEPTTEKPYGYDCEIELNGSDNISKHYVGTEAAVRRKCMMVTRARRVVSMTPLTRPEWNRYYGDPSIRTHFI